MDLESRRGTWWIAGHEAMRASGTLAVVDERIELDLAGVLLTPGEQGDLAAPIDRILGIDEHGKYCALLHCIMSGFQMRVPGPGLMAFYVSMVVLSDDDLAHRTEVFPEMAFEVDGLSELYIPSVVTSKGIGDSRAIEGVELRSVSRETLVADLGDRSISFEPQFTLKGGPPPKPTVLTHELSAIVALPEPASIDTMVSTHIKPILNLVRLGVDRQVHVTAMRVRESDSGWADVFYMVPSLHSPSKRATRNVLFAFEPDTFSDMLARWLDASERFSVVFDLYFATAYGSPMYAESRFLALAQAIEAYDRIANPTPPAERDAYAKRRVAVAEQLKAEDQEWLKEATREPQYFEEPARKRLDRSLSRYQKQFGLNARQRQSFVNRILATRNFLTHWDERGAAKAAEGADLVRLSNLLRTTLRGLLLEEAGVDVSRLPGYLWHQ